MSDFLRTDYRKTVAEALVMHGGRNRFAIIAPTIMHPAWKRALDRATDDLEDLDSDDFIVSLIKPSSPDDMATLKSFTHIILEALPEGRAHNLTVEVINALNKPIAQLSQVGSWVGFLDKLKARPQKKAPIKATTPPQPKAQKSPVIMPNRATVMALFHLYIYPEQLLSSKTNTEAVQFLQLHGMIEAHDPNRDDRSHHGWELTDKGMAWMNTVMDMPFPVAITKWVIPSQD